MAEIDLYKCTEHKSMDLAECEPIHEARYQAVMAADGSAQLDALVSSPWWTDPAGDFPCCAPPAPPVAGYADQRAHDVAWMTAAEREEYDRQLATLAPGYSPVVRGPLAMLRQYIAARPEQWITEVTDSGAHYRI